MRFMTGLLHGFFPYIITPGETVVKGENGKTPLPGGGSGVSAKGFGKKRGRKEDLDRERKRLTASATFLLLRYPGVLNTD